MIQTKLKLIAGACIALFLFNLCVLTMPHAGQVAIVEMTPVRTAAFPDPTTFYFIFGNQMDFNLTSTELVLRKYNATGDFTAWTNDPTYPFSNYIDTGANVSGETPAVGMVKWFRMSKQFSLPVHLALVERMLVDIKVYDKVLSGSGSYKFNFYVYLHFTDPDFPQLMVGSLEGTFIDTMHADWRRFPASSPIAGLIYNGSVYDNKFVDGLLYEIKVEYWSGTCDFRFKVVTSQELYTTKATLIPKPYDISVSTPMKWEIGNDLWFYAKVSGLKTNILNDMITLKLVHPDFTVSTFDMAKINEIGNVWTYCCKVDGSPNLLQIGIYSYRVYTTLDTFILTIYSSDIIKTFELFAIGQGYPRESYLSLYSTLDGFPLESKDFKIYLGDDEETSLVDFKQYTGDWHAFGGDVNATLIDDYIKLEMNNSGVKTEFQVLDPDTGTRKIISMYDYNVLQFAIKPLSTFWLVIRLNEPMEYYYYYHLTTAMVDYWWDITIPFFNFTQYHDIFGGELFEIGFYSVNKGSCLLANIRAAQYYIPVYNWWNQTLTLSETHFNYTNYMIVNNIHILANETLHLVPDDYAALYSFFDDANGANPAGWTVSEDSGTSVNVIAEKNGHRKVVELWDNSTGSCLMENSFTGQSVGSIEFWLMRRSNVSYGFLQCEGYEGGSLRFSMRLMGNTLEMRSGYTLITDFKNETWYHIRIDFNCTSDKTQTSINKTMCGEFSFYTSATIITKFRISTHPTLAYANTSFWIDAVDYSWADGYYLNRNYNASCSSGYYQSKVYDLGIAKRTFLYTLKYAVNEFNISSDVTLQYRTSANNVTWGAWSVPIMANVTINTNIARFLQFKVSMKAPVDFLAKECYWVNFTYLLENKTVIGYYENAYRLISLQNRQNPNMLQFPRARTTLCITDYFGVVLYRQEIEWSAFTDIGLPIFLLTVINQGLQPIIVRLERGYGVYLDFVVMPDTMVSIRALSSNYRLEIRNLEMNVIVVDTISANRCRLITYKYYEYRNITAPVNPVYEAVLWLFTTPWIYIILAIFVIWKIYRHFRPATVVLKMPKQRPKSKREKEDEEIAEAIREIKTEKKVRVG